MKKVSPIRRELDRNKVESSKATILAAAIKVAARPGGWSKLTRDAVAREAQCADGLVSKYFGTMIAFRRSIMREAIRLGETGTGKPDVYLSVIVQGIASGDKCAQKAPLALKFDALATLGE